MPRTPRRALRTPPYRAPCQSWFHHRYVTQIPVELIVVESETDHEAVGYFETPVVHRDLHDAARGPVQKRAHRQRIGSPPRQVLQEVAQRETGVHDVLHQEDVLALDGLVQVLGDAHHARGAALVREAGDRQEVHLHRDVDVAGQRGEEKDGALEHAHQLQNAAGVMVRDFGGYLADPLVDLLLGEEHARQAGKHGAHTSTRRSARPYLKIRFSKSFW